MKNLIATYRFQFHKDFNFDEFEKIISYLFDLGVPAVYASPIFKAIPGSTHGYDGLHPHQINPEIGSLDQLEKISERLRSHNVQWLQDIVPNHMAFHTGNEWLMDVFEKGQGSEYAPFFDIDWEHPKYQGRVIAPFLNASLADAVKEGAVTLALKEKRIVLMQGETVYPISMSAYALLWNESELPKELKLLRSDNNNAALQSDTKAASQFESYLSTPEGKKEITKRVEAINADKPRLEKLLNEQNYQLTPWQETQKSINYRRFFIVNGLISLNIHDPKVFAKFHKLIGDLVERKIFTGLRIDHIDGLYDPTQYLERLRQLIGPEVPVVVEKILEPGEDLPEYWPMQGNTGYDFLSLVNGLLTNSANEERFSRFYEQMEPEQGTFDDRLYEKKAHILYRHMPGELDNLLRLFLSFQPDKETDAQLMRETIGEFLINCPVYRYYGKRFPLEETEAKAIEEILATITKRKPALAKGVEVLRKVFLEVPASASEREKEVIAHFYRRCMQFTGPLMAKGLEDTLMYTDFKFIGHNEVGDAPHLFGISTDHFHNSMKARAEKWPLSLNATATHDTKRGEDARARLAVITDIPEKWFEQVNTWRKENGSFRSKGGPDLNDEYFLYQTLVGVLPMPGTEDPDLISRVGAYLEKALRESKRKSNWEEPDAEYESAAKEFAARILSPGSSSLQSIQSFVEKISDHGIINSLAQTLLKFTAPGIPDVYQGCELWDFSLVDPDNRRPVDYKMRTRLLRESNGRTLKDLWPQRYEGGIKLSLVKQLYHRRNEDPDFWIKADYVPLEVTGTYNRNVIAYARILGNKIYLFAAPLHTAAICEEQSCAVLQIDWKDTQIKMPAGLGHSWISLFDGSTVHGGEALLVRDLFRSFPLAAYKQTDPPGERSAGLLLHISSLPSAFGTGDLGPEAYSFADFLKGGQQRFWQMLPINPIEEKQSYSPYSSTSSRAGNISFISPEVLVKEGWIDKDILKSFQLPQTDKSDFEAAGRVRAVLLKQAWKMYKTKNASDEEFNRFCEEEKEWLEDFALYTVIKEKSGGTAWMEWAEPLRKREQRALDEIRGQQSEDLEFVKWQQYIFYRQWKALRTYCNGNEIKLVGDMPFYVSQDSADVWSHPELFKLEDSGKPAAVAGVPPDLFSATGQLWGMPVFNWDELKKTGYRWWLERIRINMKLFDLVRLDHFRAFVEYWEVPAAESTAVNGKWKPGPGGELFDLIHKEFGYLPFIAEDLGEIDQPVYDLRDRFHLKGMKVLQFAFGKNMPSSIHIPHHHAREFIVYTGTHDNNTTRGWYLEDAGAEGRKALKEYLNKEVSEEEVSKELMRQAYGSVAAFAIVPAQDVLNLDGKSRMNMPGSDKGNWSWRLLPGQLTASLQEHLAALTTTFDRKG